MTQHSISAESYRRVGTAQRALTLAAVVPSQDVTRYQARNMPKPHYALARENEPTPQLTILLWMLGLVAAGAVIIVLIHLTNLLGS